MQGGDISLVGSGATMLVQNFRWLKKEKTGEELLTFVADAEGFSQIVVAQHNGRGGTLSFGAGGGSGGKGPTTSKLAVDVSALSPTDSTAWTLITFDALSRNANGDDWQTKTITGAANPDRWSLSIIEPTGDAGGALMLTYSVPEPASLALLTVGAMMLLPRRRPRIV